MNEKNLYASDLAFHYWYKMNTITGFDESVRMAVLYCLWKDLAVKLYKRGKQK